MRSDLHVHTFCSPDSSTTPDEVCRMALESGLDAIAITDHVRYWKHGDRGGAVGYQGRACATGAEFFRAAQGVKTKYAGKLVVLAGVEISYESSREGEIRPFLAENPFEFVIGSVHDSPPVNWWDPSSASILRTRPALARKALTYYYTELRKAAESGLFDVIAHIDVYERYFPNQWPDIFEDEQLAPIVAAAVEAIAKHARMEINLTTLQTLGRFPWSALPLLQMYCQMGGKPPTLGSDAHLPGYIGKGLDKGERLAREAGFESTADWREVVRHRSAGN